MASSILLLPPELKHHIAKQSSPKTLAALARTHTTYQREAEQVLYHTISILTVKDNSLKCMEILAANSEKAALVHFLTIESTRNNIDRNRRAITYLLKGLINMHTLSDLRVRMRPNEIGGRMIKALYRILCGGHFRLQTLYCNDNLDISRIIKSQTELQILALYSNCNERVLLEKLKKLHNAQLYLPIIVTLERESFLPVFTNISIFPAFYSVDRCAKIHQVLAQSFGQDQGYDMLVLADKVSELSMYLTDSSDIPAIHALAKGMAVSFPQIHWLNFWFKRQFQISPKQKEEVLSFFSNSSVSNFYSYDLNIPKNDDSTPQKDVLRKLRPRVGRKVNYKT